MLCECYYWSASQRSPQCPETVQCLGLAWALLLHSLPPLDHPKEAIMIMHEARLHLWADFYRLLRGEDAALCKTNKAFGERTAETASD